MIFLLLPFLPFSSSYPLYFLFSSFPFPPPFSPLSCFNHFLFHLWQKKHAVNYRCWCCCCCCAFMFLSSENHSPKAHSMNFCVNENCQLPTKNATNYFNARKRTKIKYTSFLFCWLFFSLSLTYFFFISFWFFSNTSATSRFVTWNDLKWIEMILKKWYFTKTGKFSLSFVPICLFKFPKIFAPIWLFIYLFVCLIFCSLFLPFAWPVIDRFSLLIYIFLLSFCLLFLSPMLAFTFHV